MQININISTININMSSDDNLSVGSQTSSVTNQKIECPFCNKSFQIRHTFNHIHTKHRQKYLDHINSSWLEHASPDLPLRVFWPYTNDFGEQDEQTIYCCLGSNKTFSSEHKALAHFKKDKESLKKHNAEIKKLKKVFAEQKKVVEDENTKRRNAIKKLEAENNQEYCRNLWRYVLHWEEIARTMCLLIKDRKKLDLPIEYARTIGWNTFGDIIKAYEVAKKYQDEMIEVKVCNAKKQWELWSTYDKIIDAHQEMGVYAEPFDAFRSERNPTNYKISLPSPYDKHKIDEMPPYPF